MTPLEYLEASGCVLWAVAYVVLICRQHRDRSFLLPLIVLAANFSWEVLHAATLLARSSPLAPTDLLAFAIDLVWIGLDVVLIWQTLLYGTGQSPSVAVRYTIPRFGLLVAVCAGGHAVVDAISGDWTGYYSGFIADLFMFAMVGRLIAGRRNNHCVSVWFLALSFAADMIIGLAFGMWEGFVWFPAAFLCCRALLFVYCMGMYAYVVLICRQHRDRSFLLPLIVLAANFSWEVLHAATLLARSSPLAPTDLLAFAIDLVWIGLDVVLIWQTLLYGTGQSPSVAVRYTIPRFGLLVAVCAGGHAVVDAISGDWTGYYSGFIADLFMFAMVGRLIAGRRNNHCVSVWFLALSFAADMIIGLAFGMWEGFVWFPAAFLCCRALLFVYCMGMYARNRWVPERSPNPTSGCVSSRV